MELAKRAPAAMQPRRRSQAALRQASSPQPTPQPLLEKSTEEIEMGTETVVEGAEDDDEVRIATLEVDEDRDADGETDEADELPEIGRAHV